MLFSPFMLVSFPFFSMSTALMLSWRISRYSTTYPFPSMKYLDYMHFGKAMPAPTIFASLYLLLFIFCFHDSYIIDPDPMDIINPM